MGAKGFARDLTHFLLEAGLARLPRSTAGGLRPESCDFGAAAPGASLFSRFIFQEAVPNALSSHLHRGHGF